MKYKYYIWDFGGTLFNTYPGVALSFQIALKNKNIDEKIENIIEYVKVSKNFAAQYFQNKYGIEDGFEELVEKIEDEIPNSDRKPFAGSDKILQYIKDNGGMNFIYTHRSSDSAFGLLDYYNYTKFFKDIVSKEDKLKRKPDPEGFLYFISKFELKKEETLTIGDRAIDIISGVNAGIDTVYFNPDGEINKDAKWSVKNYEELFKIIK